PVATYGSATATVKARAWSTIRATTSTTTFCRSAPRTGRPWSSSSWDVRRFRRPRSSLGPPARRQPVSAHPYTHKRIGLATIHSKERAIAPPFRRLMGAEVIVPPNLDTDVLGTFSGEVPRPD